MFAGIDIASERHVLARLDEQGAPIGKPTPFSEDREGYDTLLRLLGTSPVLVVWRPLATTGETCSRC